MTASNFKIVADNKIRNNDLILLFFSSSRKACFAISKLPSLLQKTKAPAEKGKCVTTFIGNINKKRVIVKAIRLDADYSTPEQKLKKEVSAATTSAPELKANRIVVPLENNNIDLIRAAHEGAILGGYAFNKYLKKKNKPVPVTVMTGALSTALRKRLGKDKVIYELTNFARDMSNEPPNSITPSTLAPKFQKIGKESGLKVTIWNEQRLKKEKCGAIIGVGRGSKSRPRLVIGEYSVKRPKLKLCLVGKGVTFDSGGYCLKGSQHQMGMKYDMSGAAMMWAASCAIARLKLPISLTVLTPLVENRISDDAYLTSSILTMRNGITVEVVNTDAEGRLILADALVLAGERKPDYIVDAATLTGACVTALGEDMAGVLGTDDHFSKQLISAGKTIGEQFWHLPLHMPYMGQLDATIADCKNCGSAPGAGPIMGALFLRKFVPDKVKWIHLDIAGPAVKEDSLNHLGKGSKGFGVKTIVELAETLVR